MGQKVAWLQGTRGDTSSCQQQVLVVRSPNITFLWVLKYKRWVLFIFNIFTNLSCSITAWTDAGLWPALLVVLQGSLPCLTSLLPGSTWQDQALSGAWHWYILLWTLRFLHYSPQQLVEGLTFIVLLSIHANSCLTSAGSILFLNQETYLIKVTGGLAQQRQVCCLWHKKHPNNKILISTFPPCFVNPPVLLSLEKWCSHLISHWFGFLVFLFVSEEKKKNLFYKCYHVLQMSCEDSIWEKCL